MDNPSRVAFIVFGKEIYWYAICVSIGLISAIFLAMNSAKKYRWSEDDLVDFSILAIPLGIIGARLYYVFFEWKLYASRPLSIFFIWEGGLAIFGGIIGGVLAGVIYCAVKKKKFGELLDICAPSVALGQAIGRWGNFFNQEAYGALVTNPAHMWFPLAVRIDATNEIHYATFFYESMWCLFVVIFLLAMRKKFKYVGDLGLWYFMLYGIERMVVEEFRTDSLMAGPFKVSQLLSGILFLAIAIFMIIRYLSRKNKPLIITNKANPSYVWPTKSFVSAQNNSENAMSQDAVEVKAATDALDDNPILTAEEADTVEASTEIDTMAKPRDEAESQSPKDNQDAE